MVPNTSTTTPVIISIGGSLRPFARVQPIAAMTATMNTPVAQ